MRDRLLKLWNLLSHRFPSMKRLLNIEKLDRQDLSKFLCIEHANYLISMKPLLNIEKLDRQDLSKFLCIEHANYLIDELRNSPYHIDFSFSIFNGSIFTISANRIEGHIKFFGKEMECSPVLEISLYNIQRGHRGNINIRQFLNQKEVKKMWTLKSTEQSEYFNFEDIKLWVSADDDVIKDKKYPLQLLRKVLYPR